MSSMRKLNPRDRDRIRQELMKDQGNCCELCGRKVKGTIQVDHDHETGEVRGLLCPECNKALGLIQASGMILDRVEGYLLRGRPRIERDELFMGVAQQFAKRSTCPRRNVGAVFVIENRIVAHGYNGAASGMAHCTEVGCTISPVTGGCQRALHAELNAITYAARRGVALLDSSAYLTLSPCEYCAKLMVTAGISRVYCKEVYRDRKGIEILEEAGIPTTLTR